MICSVSAVIPSVGRPALLPAVESVLAQTAPVHEIIVVLDTEATPILPDDRRITLLRTPFQSGPAIARQMGIDAARGSVIAMLDDDDEWLDHKLERQLRTIKENCGDRWIASSRFSVRGAGARRRTWPRRLIEPGQSVPDYLFRFTDIRAGGAELQTSTLVFPTSLARAVRWDTHAGAPQDEPSWLIRVQRKIPDVHIVQLPEVLSIYNVDGVSVSRQRSDCTDLYIEWGLEYLSDESPRVRGDYLCTYPVSAAVSARALSGVGRSIRAALRHGRPGAHALGYATLNGARIVLISAASVLRR
jgi:glycosyltransferase involved in cell wall biosynthesis